MTIEEAIRSLILGNNQISNLIGSRFYPEVALGNNEPTPYVTYTVFNIDTFSTQSGVSRIDVDVFRISVISTNFDQALSISNKIRKHIDKYSGEVDEFNINEIIYEDRRFDFEEGSRADNRLYRAQYDYRVRYDPQQQ